MKPVSLLLAQTGPKLGNKERNLRQISEQASKARKKNVDRLVFPEVHLTGYTMRDEVSHLAESILGPSTRKGEMLAREHGVHVVFGMPEESEVKGVIHNTAVFVGPKGLVGRYRKIHLPTHSVFEERRYYRPGQEASVFKTDIGIIGLSICYDLSFPELTRLQALQGAELVVCISAIPGLRGRFFEGFVWSGRLENGVYLAYVMRVGVGRGLRFWGGSSLLRLCGG